MNATRNGSSGQSGTRQDSAKDPRLKSVRVRNPVGLDLDSVQLRYRDHARFLIHTIHRRQAVERTRGFVPLKAEYIADHFPGDGVRMRVTAALIGGGVIERDERYTIGERSKGYRLGPACGEEFAEFLLENKILLREVTQSRSRRDAEADRDPPAYRHVRESLRDVRIDRGAALADLETMKALAPTPESRLGLESGRLVVDGIHDGDPSWEVDVFGNRAHHPLSMINAPLRRHLTVTGEPLASLDVTASQPLIIGKICRDAATGQRERETPEKGQEDTNRENHNDLTFLSRNLHNRNPSDLGEYFSLCQSGLLYDAFAEDIRRVTGKSTLRNGRKIDRDYAKHMFLSQVLFGKNHYRGPLLDAFARRFPTVANVVRELKRDDFKNLCRIAQREESRIIFGGAVERCRKAGIWVVTVHDCLVCLEADVERVELAMGSAFADVGLTPRIKVGSFSGPPASEWTPRRDRGHNRMRRAG